MTRERQHHAAIVVGLGDAGEGWPELDWAAREAHSRGRPLHVLRAYQLAGSLFPWDSSTDRDITLDLRAGAQARVDTALRTLAASWPEVEAHGWAVDGDPQTILRDAVDSAELVVVGSRRLSRLGGVVLGSVSTAVAGHSAGTVVVVGSAPGPAEEAPPVVAAIDGSPMSQDVLAFAFDFASRRGRTLRVVYCWPRDLLAEMEWRVAPAPPERAERWLAETVAGWQDQYPDVDVQRAVLREHPVDGLVQESASRELLVVGAGGRRGRFSSWLGSVSQGVLHHATCPVAVVHGRQPV